MIDKIKNNSILRSLLAMALPIILANIFQATYQLIDSFWVGRLGGKAVASVAISFPIIFFLTSLGIGFAVAGATLTAQYFGAQNKKMVNHASSQTILMVIVISLTFSLIGYIFAPQILNLIGAPTEIRTNALKYLRLSFLGLIFNFAFFMFQSIMRSIGKPKVPVYIVIGTVVLNFILDPLFMFGWGPIPRMEVAGVALATIATQSVAAITGMILLFGGKYGIHLKIKDFIPDSKFIKKAFRLGLPSSIEMSARSLTMTIMTSIVASFGTLAVASYGIGQNIVQLIIILSLGISAANGALVGQNIGANKIGRAEATAKLSMKLSFLLLTTLGIVTYIFAPDLIRFFVPKDTAVIEGGSIFVRVVALTFGFIGVQMSVSGVLRASGSTLTSMILTMTSQWLVQLPLAFILSKYTNLNTLGIWFAFPITNSLMSIIYIFVFKQGKWKHKKITEEDNINISIKENTETEEIIPA